MKDMKEKKCGCIVFEIGPPVLCSKHKTRENKKVDREERKRRKEQVAEEKGLRKAAADTARKRGHDMSPFKETTGTRGKFVSYCFDCGRLTIVYDRIPFFGDQVSGKSLTEECSGGSALSRALKGASVPDVD